MEYISIIMVTLVPMILCGFSDFDELYILGVLKTSEVWGPLRAKT